MVLIFDKEKSKYKRKLTLTKFPSIPGGRGHSIPGLVSKSGHWLHLLIRGSPNEITEVTTDIMQISKICNIRPKRLTSI